MKKLLLILFCFISLCVFSQNQREVYEMLFYNSGQLSWYYTQELNKFEKTYNINLPNINSGDNKYKNLPKNMSLGAKRKSIDIRENLDMHKKMQIVLADMHLLGYNPASTKSYLKYITLFIRTAAESFPFVNSYNFRKVFGHSIRNKLDYLNCLRNYSNHGYFSDNELLKGIDSFTGEDLGFNVKWGATGKTPYVEKFSFPNRSRVEYTIEAIAKQTPFIVFLLILFLIYRIDLKHKSYISKFLLFGFIENSNLRRRYLQIISILFVFYPLIFGFYSKSYFCIVSIFENFKNTVYYTESFPLSINGYENGLIVSWDRAVLGYTILYFILYVILSVFYIISKRKTKSTD